MPTTVPIDPRDVILLVGPSATGPWAIIRELETFDNTHAREGNEKRYVFGRRQARIRTGAKTSTYDFDGIYDPTDTFGQNVLRDSAENDVAIFYAFVTNGDDGEMPIQGTEEGWLHEVQVLEYTENGDVNSTDPIACSFSAESLDDRIPMTDGLPGS